MKYAVITMSGKQHVVSEGEKLQVDLLEGNVGDKLAIKDVLLVNNDGAVSVGTPLVEGSTVNATILSHERGEKIRVATYKAKSRYRRVKGHRQSLTTVEITKIA